MIPCPSSRTLFVAYLAAVVVLLGCTPSVTPLPAAPQGMREIAVKKPTNLSGRDLVVDEPGMVGRALGERRETVPDLLAEKLRAILLQRGFRVVTAGSEGASELRTEIRGWEPFSADYSAVTVALESSLVDPATGRVLWTAQRAKWRVPTPDARSSAGASATASQEIAEALINGWYPAGASPDRN
jgi:hypothetical protein